MPASMASASATASNTIACCALLLLMFLLGTSLPADASCSKAIAGSDGWYLQNPRCDRAAAPSHHCQHGRAVQALAVVQCKTVSCARAVNRLVGTCRSVKHMHSWHVADCALMRTGRLGRTADDLLEHVREAAAHGRVRRGREVLQHPQALHLHGQLTISTHTVPGGAHGGLYGGLL